MITISEDKGGEIIRIFYVHWGADDGKGECNYGPGIHIYHVDKTEALAEAARRF